MQIAFWNETGLAQLEEAAKAAETALNLEPAHGGALALLENLYRRQRSWDRYVEILARERPARRPRPVQAAARRTARCCATSRGTPARSTGWRGVHEESGEWEAAARRLPPAGRRAAPEGAARLEAQLSAGEMLKERLRDRAAPRSSWSWCWRRPAARRTCRACCLLAAIYRERKRLAEGAPAARARGRGGRRRRGQDAHAGRGGGDLRHRSSTTRSRPPSSIRRCLALDDTRDRSRREAGRDQASARRLGRGCCRWRSGWRRSARARRAQAGRAARALWHRLGRAAEETGDEAGALEAFRSRARPRRPTPPAATLAARRDLADAHVRRQDWREAAAAYESCWRRPAGLKRATRWRRLRAAGHRAAARGQPAEAIEPLEKALALEPRRRAGAGGAGRGGASAAGNDDAVVRHTQALLAVTEDPRDEAASCSSTSRRSTASGARIRSARSPPTWRRSRSGRTSGRSCTGCSSSDRDPAVEAVGRAAGAGWPS